MPAFAYYLLKVSFCSGLLFGYYFFVLRNNRFHQYNRFYLLFAVILSWIAPLAKIEFWNASVQQEMPAIRLLKVVATRDAFVEKSLKSALVFSDLNLLAFITFTFISVAVFVWLLTGIAKIVILIKANSAKSRNNIHFIFTEVKGTPFSFFKYIFWNKNIDLQTQEGKLILQHELTHVNERHSTDKLFLQITLIIGWLNPFFWLIRKELSMIHEFIADEKAISDGDADSFSVMLLKTAYPQHSFALANSFFHSPIKRRLIMFTNSKKPSYSYFRRLMILPLLSFVIVFFSFKLKGESFHKSLNNSAKIADTDFTKGSFLTDTDLKLEIYKVIERWVGVEPSESRAKTGINVLEISNLNNTTEVKTIFASDSYFDFGNNKLLIKKISEKSKELKVPFDVIVPIYFGSDNEQPSAKLIEAAQEKINNLDKQKTVYGPVVIVSFSQSLDDDIKTKSAESAVVNSDTTEAKFPGGNMAWKKYLETNLNANVPVLKDKAPAGVYTVKLQFTVTETGEIKDVSAIKSPAGCPSCAIEAVRIIKLGPKWEPMTINGQKAVSQSVQFISFMVEK